MRGATSWEGLLNQLDDQQIYMLGAALDYDLMPPNNSTHKAYNRLHIDSRFRRDITTSRALHQAMGAGGDFTSLIYGGPARNAIFKAILPRNAYRVYYAYDKKQSFDVLRKHLDD
jgi:hypothetical protein